MEAGGTPNPNPAGRGGGEGGREDGGWMKRRRKEEGQLGGKARDTLPFGSVCFHSYCWSCCCCCCMDGNAAPTALGKVEE